MKLTPKTYDSCVLSRSRPFYQSRQKMPLLRLYHPEVLSLASLELASEPIAKSDSSRPFFSSQRLSPVVRREPTSAAGIVRVAVVRRQAGGETGPVRGQPALADQRRREGELIRVLSCTNVLRYKVARSVMQWVKAHQ